jgi:rubrerythrin
MVSQTVALLFELAIIAETSSRDFYDGLAKKFWHERNISQFWKNMAADETEHVKMIEGLRKSLTSAQLSAPAEHDITQVALENSKVQVSDVLNMVKNLNDAYVLAQLWENSEIYRVFEFLTATYTPSDTDGRFVRLHLSTHKRKLELFSEAFGEVEARKSISAMDGD